MNSAQNPVDLFKELSEKMKVNIGDGSAIPEINLDHVLSETNVKSDPPTMTEELADAIVQMAIQPLQKIEFVDTEIVEKVKATIEQSVNAIRQSTKDS
ncbi:hypothetical protein ACFSCZ_13910 [Siminovitchia sediminis]|uniref:Uncharacterized protein n=1 Tax=Siminovitchia sediminis TaxID=1274353 RepID=A0ABW4KM39_9BACI